MESYKIYPFVPGFFHLTPCLTYSLHILVRWGMEKERICPFRNCCLVSRRTGVCLACSVVVAALRLSFMLFSASFLILSQKYLMSKNGLPSLLIFPWYFPFEDQVPTLATRWLLSASTFHRPSSKIILLILWLCPWPCHNLPVLCFRALLSAIALGLKINLTNKSTPRD